MSEEVINEKIKSKKKQEKSRRFYWSDFQLWEIKGYRGCWQAR